VGITYRCDAEHGCTFVVWDQGATPEEWHGHLDRLFADPAFPPGERWLVDLGTARGAPIITDEVIAEVGKRLNAESDTLNEMRVAIVPNGTWEKARQLVDREVSIPGLRAILFNELSVACAWLGLPPGEIGLILESIRTELRGASPNQAER